MAIPANQHSLVRGSDVDRDGMYLELRNSSGEAAAEVFFSDRTGEMTLTTFSAPVPLEPVEWLIAQARILLPPAS